MDILSYILRFIDNLNKWIGKILYPLVLVICVVILIEIIMRTVFNSPTTWTFETTQFLFIICTFLAAGHLYFEGDHIKVDVFYSKLSRKGQIILDIITFPVFLFFVGSLCYYGYDFAVESFSKHETTGSVWDPIIYPIKFSVPIGSVLLLLQAVCKFTKDISELWTGKAIPKQTSKEDLGSY